MIVEIDLKICVHTVRKRIVGRSGSASRIRFVCQWQSGRHNSCRWNGGRGRRLSSCVDRIAAVVMMMMRMVTSMSTGRSGCLHVSVWVTRIANVQRRQVRRQLRYVLQRTGVHTGRDHLHLPSSCRFKLSAERRVMKSVMIVYLLHRRLHNVLREPRSAVRPNGERRHMVLVVMMVREIASQMHLRKQSRQTVGVHWTVVRQQTASWTVCLSPALVVRLVLTLILVATVGELDEQWLRWARDQLSIKYVDDLVTLFARLHSKHCRNKFKSGWINN